MISLTEKLLACSIRLPSYAPGTRRVPCPQCSHTRKKRTDPCLAVTIDADGAEALWHCHHCDWSGNTREDKPGDPPGRRPARPPEGTLERPTVEVMRWFTDRGITAEVVQRNRIGFVRQHYIAQLQAKTACIAFPYYRQGQLVNIKYRALSQKAFALVKDAESVLYGLDDLAEIGDGKLIIVEGEPDKLAAEVAGFRNVVSVPNGAPPKLRDQPSDDDPKFEYLRNCAGELEAVKGGFILALDNDDAGRVLEEELARRLGKERCWRVRWPDSNDCPCKDLNETLWVHGPQVVRECIEAAEPYPISGLYRSADYAEEYWAIYGEDRRRGTSTGWPALDEFMTIAPGQLTVVTGIPNHGKSEFLDALLVNLARRYDWHAALCSFENQPPGHLSKLAEKYLGLPFRDGLRRRMTRADAKAALDWLDEHFFFIRADDDAPATVEWILERARAAVLRYGSNVLVVDPYNEMEHRRPVNMTETEFISQMLGQMKRFAQNHEAHVFIVAHPAKPARESGGKISVPTLYDIAGSANWANKADIGVAVHRPDFDGAEVEIHVHKVRDKWIGKPGGVTLRYDRITGRYFEQVTPAAGAARAYRED
jgi:twinkle protein